MSEGHIRSFGPYQLDLAQEQLRRDTQPVRLTPKAFHVLSYIVERRGQLVTKEELFRVLWADTVVGDAALTMCIQEIRKALQDDAKSPQYLETVHRRGFRFLPTVTAPPVPSAEFRVLSQEEASSQEEGSQKANGADSLASSVQSLASENQAVTLSSDQTLDTSPSQTLDARRRTLDDFAPAQRSWPVQSLVIMGLVLLIGIILLVQYLSRPTLSTQFSELGTQPAPQALALPDKPSIIILPFTNLSGDPDQDYFSDGLTEILTGDLSQISSLFVIARNSAFTYKGKAVKMQDVSREMGVRYVLEGSVRKVEDQVRITAQLIDATTSGHLWSERYDRPLADIFALQDEIRQKIMTALKVKLAPDEQERFQRTPTNNLEAYDYFLRGVEYFWRTTKETNAQARQMFEKAIALDPHYAAAYARQGMTYVLDWIWQWNQDRQILDHAFAAAQTAVALDDSLPLAHSILGTVYQYKGQFEQAIAEGERAVVLDANDPENYRRLSSILGFAGRAEEAIVMVKTAMRLNPHYPPHYLTALGQAYHQAWRNDEAMVTLKRLLMSNPNNMAAHVMLTCSYSDAGRDEEARAEAAEVLRLTPNFTTETWRRTQTQFFREPAELERHANNLRKAGLP
jgi:TolB-like protein/DNA-binding winged helix-turn-helix (wHTH) protein/Tfp pilus assembly protein PilF